MRPGRLRRRPGRHVGLGGGPVEVRNVGARAGADVVQLYLHDPVAQVTRPVVRLVGYAKVHLEPGQAGRVTFDIPADLAAFTGRDGRRIVEPATWSSECPHRALRSATPSRPGWSARCRWSTTSVG